MDRKAKQNLLLIVVGVCLYAALMNLGVVLEYVGKFIHLVQPIIAGSILALFIDVPARGIERKLRAGNGKRRHPLTEKQLCAFSFLLTAMCVISVLVIVLTMLVPELIRSGRSLYYQILENIPLWREYWESRGLTLQWAETFITGLDWDSIAQSLTDALDGVLGNLAAALSSTVSVVITATFALIVSIYMSLGKGQLGRHVSKAIHAYLKPSWAEAILHFCGEFRKSFGKFLYGQSSEALILGTLMFLAFSIFRLPYASLVGVLTAVCAIIPYVGAFISCAISVILTLMVEPKLVLLALVVYLAVQFIENQFIYPRVVGSSVGLSPLYTLIAAMIGGKLFGIIGIIFFIPLAATVIELLKEGAYRRLNDRKEGCNEKT